MKLLSSKFVNQMEHELQNNQHKGNWLNWHPDKDMLFSEIQHHLNKLKNALDSNDKELVKEYSADIANFCEKSFTEFGS